MKLLALVVLLFGPCNLLFAQSQLEVVVTGIKNGEGDIRVGIFSDKETFLKKAVYGKVVEAKEGSIKVIIELEKGVYGVSVIHDENKNGDLDSSFIGIPREGFGFSNNAMGTFGPPRFEKASITVENGKMSISIAMKYL